MGDLIPFDALLGDEFDAPTCGSCGTVLRDGEDGQCARCISG